MCTQCISYHRIYTCCVHISLPLTYPQLTYWMMFVLQLVLPVVVLVFQLEPTTGSANVSVVEKGPAGTLVYNITKACPELPTTANIYQSVLVGSSFTTYFVLNNLIVTTNPAVPLNRDQIGNLSGNTIVPVVYSLLVVDLNSVGAVNCIINVRVLDIDDHTPTFPRSVASFSVRGGSSSPVSWPMDLAADADEGVNSTQNYYINASDPATTSAFYLNMTKDSYGRITRLQLVRNKTLNRWQIPSYNFSIVAEEGRPNTAKGYQSVFITVLDACDTSPVFQTPYQIEVPENTSVNSTVLKVKATDQVVGRNASFNYSIVSQCAYSALDGACSDYPADGSAPFALDRASGGLTLVQTVSFVSVRRIDVVVKATDPCGLAATTRVSVVVTYVNDEPPVIQFNPPVTNIVIKDNYAPESDIAVVVITSLATFTVDVLDSSGLVSDTFYLFNIGFSYRMRLRQTLDSKVRSSYNVTVRATDVGSNVAYSSVTILVRGVNHPPTFDNRTVFVSVPENTRNGTKVLGVHASDSDVGGNGVVTYDLPPPNATYVYQNNFTVTAASGDVLVNGVLDRKVARTFLLLVRARDNPTDGEPSFSDYMVVNVTLLDPVINRPIFPPQPSQVNVSENILVGSTIFQVVAYLNGSVTRYSSVPSAFFQIDSISGVIRVVGTLDYSTTRQYVLNITAYGDGFPLPSTYILTINILPGDAVGPVFAPRVYNVQVMRTAAVGSHVVDINTFSPAVLYEIVDGNGEGKFTINPTTGTISVLSRLDQASTQTYTLHVNASDGRYYSKWLAEVVLTLQDLVFVNAPYYFQVQEGLPGGTVVGTIGVRLSYAGQVQFYVANGSSDALTLDPTTGTVATRRALVASETAVLTLRVQAVYTPVGPGVVGGAIFQDVSVFVTRRESQYNVTVRRSVDVGTVVLNVTVTDTTMGIVTYSVSSTSPVPFQVNSNTGSIYTTAYLDPAPRSTYTFGIVVTSYRGPSLSPVQSLITVTIQVDLSVVFDSAAYNFSVSKESSRGALVGVVKATGRRGVAVHYTFSKDSSNTYFQIDKTTGSISLLVGGAQLPSPLNADVLAQDSNDSSIWSIATVTIAAVGVGTHSPTVGQPQITNIVIIVAIIVGVLLLLLVVLLVALVTLQRKRKSYDPKVSGGDGGRGNRAPGGGEGTHEMNTYDGSDPVAVAMTAIKVGGPPAPADEQAPPTQREAAEAGSRPGSTTSPTTGPPKDTPVYSAGDSIGRRPSRHARSTSDLASTVGTEVLSGVEDTGPYTKAQLMAIYAANAQLLQDNVSQDSVHMFGSEGGVEADDQEVDIDRMLFAKAIGFEDDRCPSEVADDGGEQYDVAKDACSAGLETRAREERELSSRYRFAEKDSWLPAVTSVTDTIDELVREEPMFSNDRISYPLSQAMSLYSEGGSQSLLIRSQPPPHQYYAGGGGGGYTPQSLHESSCYLEPDRHHRGGRHAQSGGPHPPARHRPGQEETPRTATSSYSNPRAHRYSSTTAITHHHQPPPANLPHSTGPQRRHLPPQPPSSSSSSHLRPPHTPSSNTPTDDGLMESLPPPQLQRAYYSSISSLASTNLSQPACPRDPTTMY